MRMRIICAIILAIIAVPFAAAADGGAVPSDADVLGESGGNLLIDYGNGSYEWTSAGGPTCLDALTGAVGDAEYDGSSLRIKGMGTITITGSVTVTADWKIYSWDGGAWSFVSSDPNTAFAGTMAFGLFSDENITPSATPGHPDAWTQLSGSSGAYGASPSYGPSSPALPVEWYNTYTTGYVDSGIVVSGNLLYHTTGGTYGGSGPDNDPWIYCLNGDTGSVIWKYQGVKGAGYEVTTPAVAGDLLVVTTTNGDVYVFNRHNGSVLDKLSIPFEPPVDENGDIVWDGRVFITGATTPVYDSGCVFFGTADGKVYCFSVSPSGKLNEVWCYDPPATVAGGAYEGTKGCFYYHAPVIANVDGKRMLFIGNYEGYLHALDITTGDPVWVERIVDMRADNRCVPGTPGSAGSVVLSPDGTVLLASCTDGGLFTLDGYLTALDPATGDVLTRDDGSERRTDGLFTAPVSTSGGFYTYATPVGAGSRTLTKADGGTVDFTDAVYMFDWDGMVVWRSKEYQLIKAPLTLADGVLYATDYSAGAFWPTGGGLTAISADDGSELWRVRLSPYTADSYSMVQPTVIGGKVYVGNDFGAVYCVSLTAGPGTEEERIEALMTVGFSHWSWAAVGIAAMLCIVLLYRYY